MEADDDGRVGGCPQGSRSESRPTHPHRPRTFVYSCDVGRRGRDTPRLEGVEGVEERGKSQRSAALIHRRICFIPPSDNCVVFRRPCIDRTPFLSSAAQCDPPSPRPIDHCPCLDHSSVPSNGPRCWFSPGTISLCSSRSCLHCARWQTSWQASWQASEYEPYKPPLR